MCESGILRGLLFSMLWSCCLSASVVAVGDAEVEPVVVNLSSGQSLDNNSYVYIIPNQSLSLFCSVTPTMTPPTWWLLRSTGENDGKTLISSANTSTDPRITAPSSNSSTLVVQSLGSSNLLATYCCQSQDGDDELAKCVALSLFPSKAPYNVHVGVGSFANLTQGQQSLVNVSRGVPLLLSCLYPSDVYPTPSVVWIRDGVRMLSSGGEGSSLILSVNELSGHYTCEVSNGFGSASSGNATVVPIDSLVVSIDKSHVLVGNVQTKSINLTCSVINHFHQSLIYKWQLRGSDRLLGRMSNLLVGLSSSPGDYECIVRGSLGVSAKATVQVSVYQEATFQVVLEDIPNCGHIHTPSIVTLESSVTGELVRVFSQLCNCEFTASNFASTTFSCYPDGYRNAVFRAELVINTTSNVNSAASLISNLAVWIRNGGSLVAGDRRYAVAQGCAIGIDNLDVELCSLERPTTFTVTLNMIYSFVIGIGFALILLTCLLMTFCCLIRCRHSTLSQKQRKRKEKEGRPIIELVQHTGLEPPAPLDPSLSIRTNNSWSSVLKEKVPSRQSLAGSRESIRSDTDEIIQVRADKIKNGKYKHQSGDDSPDSGLILNHTNGTRTGSLLGSTQSLPNKHSNHGSTSTYLSNEDEGGEFNLGITPSLEGLVEELYPQPSSESEGNAPSEPPTMPYPYYPAPVSRSLQRLDYSGYGGEGPASSPASPQVVSRGQVKSENLNMTATDEMLQLIEEVRAARAAFQQILDRTPEGSPILSRNTHRTQSFRDPSGRDGAFRGSDPKLRATRTGSGTGVRPGLTIDGSNASMNAYWIEKLRSAKTRQGETSPVPLEMPSSQLPKAHMGSNKQYDQLEPKPHNSLPRKLGIAAPGVSPLTTNNQSAVSPTHASHEEVFPPPPPPATAFSNGSQVAGGPVFVPVPMPPAAMPYSTSTPASIGMPPPPPPPPILGEVAPPVPRKPKKKAGRPLSHGGVDRVNHNQSNLSRQGLGQLVSASGENISSHTHSKGGSLRGLDYRNH